MFMQVENGSLSPHELRCIAVLAEVDPRTVAAHLAGKRVRSISRLRIERSMRELRRRARRQAGEAPA
jgi:hypothetical protein